MLPSLIAVLLAQEPAAAVRIETAERDAALAVRLNGTGWSQACPAPVTFARPCDVKGPVPPLLHLAISGSRTFEASVALESALPVVRLEHKGYDLALGGLATALAGIAAITVGAKAVTERHPDEGRPWVSLGSGLVGLGTVLVMVDLTRIHDRAVVVR
jgi:hypothetical protein